MVVRSVLLLDLLSLHVTAQPQVTCTAGCLVLPTSFPSLDSALSSVLGLEEVVLSLSASPADYELTSPQSVGRSLYVQGNNQTLLFAAPLKVQVEADLKVREMSIDMRTNGSVLITSLKCKI